MGFQSRLTLASLPWPLPALPPVKTRTARLEDPDAAEERFAQLARNLADIAADLRERTLHCRVLAVGYLAILPPDGEDRGGPPPAQIAAWDRPPHGDAPSPPSSQRRRGHRCKPPAGNT